MKKLCDLAIICCTLIVSFASGASAQTPSPCYQQCGQAAQMCLNGLTEKERNTKFSGKVQQCQDASVSSEMGCDKKPARK